MAWLVVVVLAAVAAAWLAGVSGPAALALAQDSLPLALFAVWIVLAAAVLGRRWVLAGAAGTLGVLHVAVLVSALAGADAPDWIEAAPRLRVAVANVYVDNDTPEQAAAALLGVDADVLVVVESTIDFLAILDAQGGGERYPHRVSGGIAPDYLVTIASRVPIDTGTVEVGTSSFAPQAFLTCGTTRLELVGVNPAAAVDPGGYELWQDQLAGLEDVARASAGPLVIAGDLNTTQFRPDFERLLDVGLRDAHTTMGDGLDASFRLAAEGPLASIGAVARLDRLLFGASVWPLSLDDVAVPGSDHEGFVAELAVDADGPCVGP